MAAAGRPFTISSATHEGAQNSGDGHDVVVAVSEVGDLDGTTRLSDEGVAVEGWERTETTIGPHEPSQTLLRRRPDCPLQYTTLPRPL